MEVFNMNIVKFIRKQGKTKDADPKIFEESITCNFPLRAFDDKVIPISSIKDELIKCSFKAEEPEKFFAIIDGKGKKVNIDCFDTVNIIIPKNCKLKAVNFKDMNSTDVTPNDIKEYEYVEKKERDIGDEYTIFFGDFLKMIMHDQYNTIHVVKDFYNRMGDVPVIIDSENEYIDIFSAYTGSDPRNPYIELTTEKGDIYFIHINF